MKNSFPRRLSAAVLAGTIAFTGLGLAAPAMAAPTPPAVGATSFAETITASIASDSGYGYAVEEVHFSLDTDPGPDFVLEGSGIYHQITSESKSWSFTVKLGDQPQVITELVAKHKDGLVGADKRIVLAEPLVIGAFTPWPASVLDSRITMPDFVLGQDSFGYTTVTIDGEHGTSTADLERARPQLEMLIDGEHHGDWPDGSSFTCDGPDSLYDGKTLEFRAHYKLKSDQTARHGAVFVDCPASIPLKLELSQSTTSVKRGEEVTFEITNLEGTYGKEASIVWLVDGKEVESDGLTSFNAPESSFSMVQAQVTATDRAGKTLVKKVGWANAMPDVEVPDVEVPDTETPDVEKPGGNPDDGQPDAGDKPDSGEPDAGKPDTGGKPDAGGNPDTGDKPGVDIDISDDDDTPYKSECEGLCDRGDKDDQGGKPDLGVGIVKPKPLTSTPGVMSDLSAEALAKLG